MKYIFTLIMSCMLLMCFAQKPEKGSSPQRPWSDDVQSSMPASRYDGYDTTTKYSNLNSQLYFGKWSVEGKYLLYTELNKKEVKEDLKLFPWLMGVPANVERELTYSTTIDFKGKDPDKNKFTGSFYFTDSLFEAYTQKGFFEKIGNYTPHYFKKTAAGYMLTSVNDSVTFAFTLYYENKDSLLNQQSYIHTPKNTIYVKPFFENKASHNDVARSLYAGFDFIIDGKTAAQASIRKDFVGDKVYKYWMSNELDAETKQVIASGIYIVVCFY